MENQTKSSDNWIRNHIIVCGVPEYREPVTAAISEHLKIRNEDQKKKEA